MEKKAVDNAVSIGADALIIADLGILDYAANTYPDIERHVSVQASTTNLEAIKFFLKIILMLVALFYPAYCLFNKFVNWLKIALYLLKFLRLVAYVLWQKDVVIYRHI